MNENMNENIKEFLKKVAADESLQAKMKSFTNADEAYEFAKSVQDGFSKEEFVDVMTKIKKAVNEKGELTDEDLAAVAGGNDIVSDVVSSVIITGAGVAAMGAFV